MRAALFLITIFLLSTSLIHAQGEIKLNQIGFYPDAQKIAILPATTFMDHWCSYSTNEVTINWNAPMVYLLGALEVFKNQ